MRLIRGWIARNIGEFFFHPVSVGLVPKVRGPEVYPSIVAHWLWFGWRLAGVAELFAYRLISRGEPVRCWLTDGEFVPEVCREVGLVKMCYDCPPEVRWLRGPCSHSFRSVWVWGDRWK